MPDGPARSAAEPTVHRRNQSGEGRGNVLSLKTTPAGTRARVDQGKFRLVLSVPLVLEYEDVAKRQARALGLRHSDIDDILDYVCSIGEHRRIYFLWRPLLPDPRDDLVLELAVEAQADASITYNVRDFELARTFGLEVLTPQQFLRRLEVR